MAEEQNTKTDDPEPEFDIQAIATDLSEFLNVDTQPEAEDVIKIIDGILAKLEEFCNVIDSIRMESKDVLFITIPVLHERCSQLEPIFQKVKYLEDFVGVVKGCVEDAEEKVRIAEKELGNKNIKKIMQTVRLPKFLANKKELQPYLKREIGSHDYNVPRNFKTDDYFNK